MDSNLIEFLSKNLNEEKTKHIFSLKVLKENNLDFLLKGVYLAKILVFKDENFSVLKNELSKFENIDFFLKNYEEGREKNLVNDFSLENKVSYLDDELSIYDKKITLEVYTKFCEKDKINKEIENTKILSLEVFIFNNSDELMDIAKKITGIFVGGD